MNAPMQTIIETLQADRKSRSPRYPVQALPAVRDPRVAEVLERHLAAGARLVGIRALPYEATLGLIPVVFELEPSGGVVLGQPSVLTLVDGRGHVAALIDGYDPTQPNPNYTPPDPPGAQPFVLQEESAADAMQFSEADLAPAWNRTQEYIRGAAPAFPAGREGGDEETFCTQSTLRSTALTSIPTLSGGLFVRLVDDSKTLTQLDSSTDMVADDSIIIDEPQVP